MNWLGFGSTQEQEAPTAEDVVAEVIEDDNELARKYSKRTNIEVLRE